MLVEEPKQTPTLAKNLRLTKEQINEDYVVHALQRERQGGDWEDALEDPTVLFGYFQQTVASRCVSVRARYTIVGISIIATLWTFSYILMAPKDKPY